MDKPTSDQNLRARSRPRGGGLGAAHRGYAYQDLVTAYLLVRTLAGRFDSVTVDRKAVTDDRFDDLETTSSSFRVRRQLKSSTDPSAALGFSDFNSFGSSLRFDRLVNTMIAEGSQFADEYRLCVTWQPPKATDALSELLVASSDSSTFTGLHTKTFRVDASKLWPPGGQPTFTGLRQAPEGSVRVTREEVVCFAQRFVIEASLPPASLDLSDPGALERALLAMLSDEIGIGRYPNHDREAVDAAALAIYVASTARVAGETLRAVDISQRLQLRTDFGRISQAFPIDKSILQERLPQRQNLSNAFKQGGVHLALAGPGSGKSWLLTQVADDLRKDGIVVARHYCFLEPGDDLVEQRVTTNVFFGNLLGELDDAFESGGLPQPPRFAAGLDALDDYLKVSTGTDHRIVIIVDGLDHIARVRGASVRLSDNETDIVERLATMELPRNVTLVVGSQPGMHLQPLRDAFATRLTEHAIAPWTGCEIVALAQSHGVASALDAAHFVDEVQRAAFFGMFIERSEGNPLYARYLSRGLVEGLGSGAILSPMDWITATPTIQGDIALYYRHLYESISADAKAIADIVGVLEFSINEDEFREIAGPVLSDWVPEALKALSPVLSVATGQSGLRIFHESFRRFMLLELSRRGRHLSNVLFPVITWLQAKDFFVDAKSYRFTFSVLSRAGRESEILQIVSATFVQRSLQFGHPEAAIERNLELAADVAALEMNWPALVRCAELLRALDSCFSPAANDWEEYWKTYRTLFGAEALSGKLLFDGKPTLSREEGVLVCEMVDSAGSAAPWREYLALPVNSDTEYGRGEFTPFGSMSNDEVQTLAVIRGRLRLGQTYRIARRVHERLVGSDADISSRFLRKLSSLLAREISSRLVEQMVRRSEFVAPRRYSLEGRYACALLLGLADVAAEDGNYSLSTTHATAALTHATSPEEAVWCVERGASTNQALHLAHALESFTLTGPGTNSVVSAPAVSRWIASARILARDPSTAIQLFEQQKLLQGDGWYKCWLRFALRSALVEAAAAKGNSYDISPVFDELVVDTNPFTGSPAACHLYSIEALIAESLRRSMGLLRNAEEWRHAIASISEARSETATQLDREDSGPISAHNYFSLLLEHAATPAATALIVERLEEELASEEQSGTYYSSHAVYRMRLARLQERTSNHARALEHWNEASVFLLGYGFHKDVALFDVIDSVPALSRKSEKTALDALDRLQPLLTSVIRHTDGRETKRAPNAWFRALLKISPERAIELLCRDYARELGQFSWVSEDAHEDILEELKDIADPMLLDALWETLPLEIKYENSGNEVGNARLHPLERLIHTNPHSVRERFTRLCAEVFDDACHHRDDAIRQLQSFAHRHMLSMPWTTSVQDKRRERPRHEEARRSAIAQPQPVQAPIFPPSPSFVEILTTLRRLSQQSLPDDDSVERSALLLSYLITEMVSRGEELEAQRLIHFLVRETPSWNLGSEHPIAILGRCLDSAGHEKLAAVALTLTFTSSRGGGGWLNFGGKTHAPSLQRAMEIDRELALKTLAEETARRVRGGGFNGICRHLIERISDWGDVESAADAWEEALSILASRLPLPGTRGYLERLDPAAEITWSIDEALAALVLARIGNPSLPRKIAALSSFGRLLEANPDLFSVPLTRLLTRDATVSTVQAVLQVLLETPADISRVLVALDEILRGYARGSAWSLSWLAEQLLTRSGRPIAVTRSRTVLAATRPSPRGLAFTKFADVGKLLEPLERLWPEMRSVVAARMDELAVDNEHFQRYLKERNEISFGRSREGVPGAIVTWPTELFIVGIDEALMGLHEHLWRRGHWETDAEEEIANHILPDIRAHLAIGASRVPRPDWPAAREAKKHLGPIVRVPETDRSYGGWIRLGIHEQCFFRSDERSYGRPDKTVLMSAAVVATELNGTIPSRATPLPLGDIGDWWFDITANEALADRTRPQLVRLGDVEDWLGKNLLLLPPLILRHGGKLEPPEYGAPLKWLDRDGQPAVALRSWRVRDQSSGPEGYFTQGCDLLLRPDLLSVLEQAYGMRPLRELQRVHVNNY